MKKEVKHMVSKYFGEKEEGVKYKRREGVYAIMMNANGQIATVKTPRGSFLPGGGIEAGEDHFEALVREVKEEIGHEVEIGSALATYGQFLLGKKVPIYYELIGTCYECRMGKDLGCKTEEDHELEWLEINHISNKLVLEYQNYAIEEFLLKKNLYYLNDSLILD